MKNKGRRPIDPLLIQKTLLLADIGATNARFTIVSPDSPEFKISNYKTKDFLSLQEALEHFLKPLGVQPQIAAIAIACPTDSDEITMTNASWTFSQDQLKLHFGFEDLIVVNDFVAIAKAIPYLKEEDMVKVGGGDKKPKKPMVVLGPGTGLGISTLIPAPQSAQGAEAAAQKSEEWVATPGEGGHVTMPASDDHEATVLSIVRKEFGHASAERVLSGHGLENLYQALFAIKKDQLRFDAKKGYPFSDSPFKTLPEQAGEPYRHKFKYKEFEGFDDIKIASQDEERRPEKESFDTRPFHETENVFDPFQKLSAENIVAYALKDPQVQPSPPPEVHDMCKDALDMFCAMLGTIAGNYAITISAEGGVYIAGGMVPRFLDYFKSSPFQARFEEKGRFGNYMNTIPTYVITHPAVAFIGLSRIVLEKFGML
ncbi:MAG: hypothetical protein HOI80_04425 [Alphaproteobacteria bacterium]|jgi:glucokinase|nr:hypothetical protein [Alphaproteobacteria bacterium]MBT5389832.1 hypothetical protein [Alphaproteobacteria bacterium]MBT5654728.1 hypothetical protein [Alphaproteobacteria bacterium]